jgi:hypothetical protein
MHDMAGKHRVINGFNAVHVRWDGVNEEHAAKGVLLRHITYSYIRRFKWNPIHHGFHYYSWNTIGPVFSHFS